MSTMLRKANRMHDADKDVRRRPAFEVTRMIYGAGRVESLAEVTFTRTLLLVFKRQRTRSYRGDGSLWFDTETRMRPSPEVSGALTAAWRLAKAEHIAEREARRGAVGGDTTSSASPVWGGSSSGGGD